MPSAVDLVIESLARDVAELEADAGELVRALHAEQELRRVLLDLYATTLGDLKSERVTSARLRDELRMLARGRAA